MWYKMNAGHFESCETRKALYYTLSIGMNGSYTRTGIVRCSFHIPRCDYITVICTGVVGCCDDRSDDYMLNMQTNGCVN